MSERDKKEGKGGRADSRVDWVGATASIGSVRPRITDFCHFGSVDRLTEDRKGHDDATAFSLMATFSITAARPSRRHRTPSFWPFGSGNRG